MSRAEGTLVEKMTALLSRIVSTVRYGERSFRLRFRYELSTDRSSLRANCYCPSDHVIDETETQRSVFTDDASRTISAASATNSPSFARIVSRNINQTITNFDFIIIVIIVINCMNNNTRENSTCNRNRSEARNSLYGDSPLSRYKFTQIVESRQ